MATIATRPPKRPSKAQRRHRRQTKKARKERRRLAHLVDQLPRPARALFSTFLPFLARPTFLRLTLLALAAILTLGGRTVCNCLRTLGALCPGHPSSYHRTLATRRWSPRRIARALLGWLIQHLLPPGPIYLAADDTVTEHPGKKVYGKGRHRDPVRSTRTYTAFRWGHKWLVLAALARFPFTSRRWALPFFVTLCRTEADNRRQGRRHKTPTKLLGQMLRVLLRWFPDRHFICAADGGYAAHELAVLVARYPGRLTFVSHFYADANLYTPPPPYAGKGRPRKKGAKQANPAAVVAAAPRQRLHVAWYGGGRREVEVVSQASHWYKAGQGLVLVRWVFVHDRTGSHRDEYFFSTDPAMTATELIEIYTGRWNLETTFEEMRSYLHLETSRGWSKNTVLRTEPCLFGLYTVVAVLYSQLPPRYARAQAVAWPGKQEVTFSDAITAVRRWLWQEWIFALPGYREAFAKLAKPFRTIVLAGLAPAA